MIRVRPRRAAPRHSGGIGRGTAAVPDAPADGDQSPSGLRPGGQGLRDGACAVGEGFSLVELVISMAILSVGLVGAMRVFPVGLRASQRAEVRSRAAIVAQRTVESLKLEPCETLADQEEAVERFTVTVRIGRPDLQPLTALDRLKKVEVAADWSGEGQSRSLAFVTYLWCAAS